MRVPIRIMLVAILLVQLGPAHAQSAADRRILETVGGTAVQMRAALARVDELEASNDGQEGQLQSLARINGIQRQTLRAVALALGAQNPDLSREQFLDLITARAASAAAVQQGLNTLTATVAALDPGGDRRRATELLDIARVAFEEGRLADVALAYDELRPLQLLQTAAGQAALSDLIVASINLAALSGNPQQGDAMADAYDAAEQRRSLHGRWAVRLAQAEAWANQGWEDDSNAGLLNAIRLYRTVVLPLADRNSAPQDWVRTQNGLGETLLLAGLTDQSNENLLAAHSAFNAVLEVVTKDNSPFAWASAQAYLASATCELGLREGDPVRLLDSVRRFRHALEIYVPLDKAWHVAQTDLATCLHRLAVLEDGTERLRESEAEFRTALHFLSDPSMSSRQASVRAGLAAVLAERAFRDADERLFGEAEALIERALATHTQERFPVNWAYHQIILGDILYRAGILADGTVRLERADVAYRAAIAGLTTEITARDRAQAQHDLADTLRVIATRTSGTDRLEAANAAYGDALTVRSRHNQPYEWAMSTMGVAATKALLANRTSDRRLMREAQRLVRDVRSVAVGLDHERLVGMADELLAAMVQSRREPN